MATEQQLKPGKPVPEAHQQRPLVHGAQATRAARGRYAGGSPQVELIGLSGALRPLTRSFVGPQAVHGVRSHFADKALISVKGVTEEGQMTDPDALEAEVKRAMIGHARTPLLLVDGSKFERPALNAILPVTAVGRVLAADAPPHALTALGRLGAAVDRV